MSKIAVISRRRFAAPALFSAFLAALPARSAADAQTQRMTQRMNGDEMVTLTPYLLFDGNCRQAMEFYRTCFGGELTAIAVKDSPVKERMTAAQQDKILNARLRSGKVEISASDWLRPDRIPVRGNTVCLYLSGATLQELKALFAGLSQGAEVTDPLTDQFSGTYGALNDKFGVRWMFQTDKKA